MTNVFADTAYWIALASPRDQLFEQALKVSRSLEQLHIVTSEWVLVELLNSFAESGTRLRAASVAMVQRIMADRMVSIEPCDAKLFSAAFDLYADRADKGWSVTDCGSFLIMQRLGIEAALTKDRHFGQAGFRALLRS